MTDAATRRSRALAFKLFAMVLALGGVLAGVLAFGVTRLPTSERAGGLVYVIPGSRGSTVVDPAIVTVLGVVAALFGGLAIAALLALRWPGSITPAVPRPGSPVSRRRRMPRRVLAGGLLLLVLVLPIRWYGYVTGGPAPSNTVGRWLNAHAPAAFRAWGCARLQERAAGRPTPAECRTPGDPASAP